MVFLWQFDYVFSQAENLEKQVTMAKTDFNKGNFKDAAKRLARLEAIYESVEKRDYKMEQEYGETLLLLAACCEKADIKELKDTATEKYRLAKEKLGAQLSIPYVDLNDLKIYRKILKEELKSFTTHEKALSWENSRKMLNDFIDKFTNQGTGTVIQQPGHKNKKFPVLLVVGIVVVVAGVIAYLLTKKKPEKTLTVTVGEGVDGNPTNGAHKYKQGSNAGYSYTLKNGYSSLSVKLDGADVPASGNIKMDKDHILTVTAAKTYTLTVTKGIGVDGTPESGTFSYNSGDTVNYSYSLQAGYQDLTVKLDGLDTSAGGTITMNANHTLTVSAGKTYTLTVNKGAGIIGMPDSGTFLYKDGTTVNYSYSLQTGYTNLVVNLDGSQINESGIITMDKDHILTVTSGKTYTLTVSKGTGVNGTPANGTFTYNDGNTVTYNYTLQIGYKNLTVTLDGVVVSNSGTITMSADHALSASAAAQDEYMLVVTRSKGVTGTPAAGTTNPKEGTSIPYSFGVQTGYRELTVTLDGAAVSASGTFTMTQNRTLSASAKEEKTLTVTRGTGVNGTPASGTFKYAKGTNLEYSYTLKTGYSNLVVTLDGNIVNPTNPNSASGTIAMNENHTLAASASTAYTLTVTRNAGVNGEPLTGVYTIQQGQTVNYAYSLLSGYQDLVVTLDGNPVAANGPITMNTNHVLVASATKVWTLTVIRGEGVNGNPDTSVSTHVNGSSAPYNYSLQGGYTNLVVTVDGNPVGASGSVTMTANHTLVSSATATIADQGKR